MTIEEYVNSNVVFEKSLYDKFEVSHIYKDYYMIKSIDTTINMINMNGVNICADAPFISISLEYNRYHGFIIKITPIDIDEYNTLTIILKEDTKVRFSVKENSLIINIKEKNNNE